MKRERDKWVGFALTPALSPGEREKDSMRISACGQRAFTLLELLLAVMVFGIVLAAIHTVFVAGLKLRTRTADMVERSLPLQQTLSIIKRDLQNLVPPGGTLAGPLQSTPTLSNVGGNMSRQNGPAFYTAVGVVDDLSPFGDIERVSYFLASPTNNAPGMDLFRSVTRNLLPVTQSEASDQFLMGGVEDISFQYYDGNAWQDTWDSTATDSVTGLTNNLPRAIKLELQLYRESERRESPMELVVPVMVMARTNIITEIEGAL